VISVVCKIIYIRVREAIISPLMWMRLTLQDQLSETRGHKTKTGGPKAETNAHRQIEVKKTASEICPIIDSVLLPVLVVICTIV